MSLSSSSSSASSTGLPRQQLTEGGGKISAVSTVYENEHDSSASTSASTPADQSYYEDDDGGGGNTPTNSLLAPLNSKRHPLNQRQSQQHSQSQQQSQQQQQQQHFDYNDDGGGTSSSSSSSSALPAASAAASFRFNVGSGGGIQSQSQSQSQMMMQMQMPYEDHDDDNIVSSSSSSSPNHSSHSSFHQHHPHNHNHDKNNHSSRSRSSPLSLTSPSSLPPPASLLAMSSNHNNNNNSGSGKGNDHNGNSNGNYANNNSNTNTNNNNSNGGKKKKKKKKKKTIHDDIIIQQQHLQQQQEVANTNIGEASSEEEIEEELEADQTTNIVDGDLSEYDLDDEDLEDDDDLDDDDLDDDLDDDDLDDDDLDDDDLDDDDLDDDDDDLDDGGQDHAIPDDPPTSPNHETTWKPQSTTSTCEFTHTITNYSQKRESGCKKAEYSSTTIDNYGNKWRLIVYVNGNGRASNHHLSLFLQVADADDLPFGWKKGVSYVLTLEHPSGPTLGYAKRNPDKTFKLCPKAIDWGWSQFITSDRVQQEGYIQDDTLTVRASVTVKSSSISIDPDDAELYLKCAVEEGNADDVEACLAQGASVNCKFKDDLYTPLHTACSSSTNDGSLEVLKLLLKRGANGNACNKWKETPLLIAANNGHRAAVSALLENGADPSMCSEAGWSALTFAAHKGYDDIVALLLAAGAPVNCRVIEDFSTPLHKACAGGKPGHLSAVKQLISGKADVHSLNKWRETPLLTAANHGQAAAVEALLDAGGDPCKCTDTGWSPLSIAAYKGHDDVVRLLLEQGAPTEEADPTLSALLQAATKGLPDTVELLLRHGADHTVTTKKGDTALSILVEQNMIDAAVQMVTEYKASIPRCSRDRKKVQRARLLITLRTKQQERKGDLLSDEGSDHDDSDEGSRSALHDPEGSPRESSTISSKRRNKKSRERRKTEGQAEREEKAEKAAEALLLELAQEESKAQKDEAAATSKRNKKKKKRERERQQKLEEERRKAAEERERQELLREEKERKEREAREKQKKEQEKRDAAERERMAAKRKEKEEKDRKKRDQVKKEQMKKEQERKEQERKERQQRDTEMAAKNEKNKTSPKGASNDIGTSHQSNTSKNASRVKAQKIPEHQNRKQTASQAKKTTEPLKTTAASSSSGKRGWEVKSNFTNSQQKSPDTPLPPQKDTKISVSETPKVPVGNQPFKSSVEDQLENMANSVVLSIVSDSASNVSNDGAPGSSGTEVSTETADQLTLNETPGSISIEPCTNQTAGKSFAIESAALSVERQEKVNDLLHRANASLNSVDIHTVKTIIYKWIVRASYETTAFLDPVIPSWTDSDMLVAFFQRQLISESRRGGNASNIEAMKEAGTFLAELCLSKAKEVVDFSKKYGETLPAGTSDSTLNMSARRVVVNNNNTVISVDWAGCSVYLPELSFSNLRNRYSQCNGPSHLILTSIFSMVKRYQTLSMITSGTAVDCRLSLPTLNELASEMKVSIDLLNNPLFVLANQSFCGLFADIDTLFGGFNPFSEDRNDAESLLATQGGSAVVLPPLESKTASIFMKKITNVMDIAEGKGLPVSVVAFLPMLCFRDLKTPPRVENLSLLEPRLLTTHQRFIRYYKLLDPGQHAFRNEADQATRCHTGSMILFLQNDAGGKYFPFTEHTVVKINHSMVLPLLPEIASTSSTVFQPIPTSSSNTNTGPVSPSTPNNNLVDSEYNNTTQDHAFVSDLFPNENKGTSRLGRVVDLVDDGDDDFNEVSKMVNELNVSMFQNNPSQDVDIEAISLGFLGIGTHQSSTGGNGSIQHQSRRFN